MFSKEGLDRGTAVLLEHMQLPLTGSVLDLGCGIGVIGIIVKRTNTALKVTQSDVTVKARHLTYRNTVSTGTSTRVVRGNCYEKVMDEKFDVIFLNPPRAAGFVTLPTLVSHSYELQGTTVIKVGWRF